VRKKRHRRRRRRRRIRKDVRKTGKVVSKVTLSSWSVLDEPRMQYYHQIGWSRRGRRRRRRTITS
jgi:hypothetical protein